MIPKEAIEAAAAAIQVRTDQPLELDDLARAALEAASLHLMAIAWDEGRDYFEQNGWSEQNPYRKADAVEAAAAAAIQVRTDQPIELEDLARAALDAAAPHMPHIHHYDVEAHARSFNEGYATAIAQQQGVGMSDSIKAADISQSHLGLRATFAQDGFSITDRLRGVSHEAELSEGGVVATCRTLLTFANAGRVLADEDALILVEASDAS